MKHILNKNTKAHDQAKKNNKFFFQPMLTINQPNDIYAQETDAVADKIMCLPETSRVPNRNKPF